MASLNERLVSAIKRLTPYLKTSAIVKHMKANPFSSASQAILAMIFLMPGLAATTLCSALGFGVLGPTAGCLAPAFQSIFGTPAGYSFLQSAAMGGWATGILSGTVQGSAILGGVLVQLMKRGRK